MTSLLLIVQNIVGGLGIGCVYALIALGFSLIFRAMGLVNFAQGNLLMFGTYLGLTFYMGLLGMGKFSPIIAFLIGIILSGVLGIALERLFRPLANLDLSYILVGTIGIGIMLDNIANHIWGSEGLVVPAPIPNNVLNVGGVRITPYIFIVIAMTALLVVSLQLFLTRTNFGRGLRASAQDREIAACFGVPVNLMNAVAFALGAALAAAAGLLIAPMVYVNPAIGGSLGVKGFVAAIIGGLGDLPGAVIGGLLFGVIETVISGYISSSYTGLIAYLLLTIILVVRPEGLLGARTIEKV
jgi:branched-chain amino acid transport system permease protein